MTNSIDQQQTRRIDSHAHFWKISRGDYDWMTDEVDPIRKDCLPEDLFTHLKKAEIHEAVVVQAAATVEETEFLLDIAENTGFVTGVVGWVPADSPEGPDILTRLATNQYFKGIRSMIHFIPDPNWILKPDLKPTLRALSELDLAFDCMVLPEHLMNIHTILTAQPDLRAVIDHIGKPDISSGAFEGWARDMKRLAKDTNCVCKLSHIISRAGPNWNVDTLRPYTDFVFEQFGPKRIMFGSDWPVLTLDASYEKWLETVDQLLKDTKAEEKDMVMGKNAVDVYKL